MIPAFTAKRRPSILAASAAVLLGLGSVASAASATWQDVGNDWTTNANWSAAFPNGAADVATFGAAATFLTPTISLGDITVSNIEFTAAATAAYTVTLDGTAGNTSLTFTGSGVNNGSAVQQLFSAAAAGANTARFIFTGSASAGTNTAWTLGAGGQVSLQGTSTGGTAAFTNNAGGRFDISENTGASVAVGSIAGGGDFFLGSRRLIVGGNNASTSVSGTIQDGGAGGGAGGALEKTGTGKLTLSGNNSYTGGTTLGSGALFVDHNNGVNSINRALGTGTLTITGGTLGTNLLLSGFTTPGGNSSGTTLPNNIALLGNVSIATGVSAPGLEGTQNFTLSGNVNLNNGVRTITGVISQGQPHFTGVFSNGVNPGDIGGLTFAVDPSITTYVAFIMDGANPNTYTGLTTVEKGAFLVVGNTATNGAIQGNVLVKAGGSLDYFRSEQVADTATVTVNSTGLDAGATHFAGLELQNNNETIDTLLGTGTVGLSSGTLTVNQGNFSGVIEDGALGTGGKLTKNSSGTLTLSGVNTYTGVTTVNGGTLVSNGALVSSVLVNNGSTFDNNGLLQVGNNVSGMVVAANSNILNTGAIAGGAIGSEGVVLNGAGNTLTNEIGAVITADRAVVLNNATGTNTIVNRGVLTGTGGVAIDTSASGGGLVFTNIGTVNGSVLLGSGNDTVTLVTDIPVNGPVNGGGGTNTLRLVGAEADTLNLGRVSNFSTLIKLGGGSWTLTGVGVFAGGTTVNLGNLVVDGQLTSNVTIQSGGLLGGNGTIIGNLRNFGTVNPGNSPGKITVTGNFSQDRSGTLVIEIPGKKSGQHDELAVGGEAQLDGTLRLSKAGGNVRLKLGEKVTFLTAKGGVSGKFAEVDNPFTSDTMIQPEVVYRSNSVALEGTQGSYVEFADQQNLTPNERSVARVVDAAASTGQSRQMVKYLNGQPLGEIPGDLDRIAPEELASVFRLGVALADTQAQNLQRRMEDLRLSSRRPVAPPPPQQVAAGEQTFLPGSMEARGQVRQQAAPAPSNNDRWGVFFTGGGQATRLGTTENARGYEMTTGGITIGLDYRLMPNLVVGVTMGYANTGADLTGDGKVLVNTGSLGFYGTYFTGGFHADAVISSGYDSYQTRRASLGGNARGQTDGFQFNALIAAGYDWKPEAFTLGPIASVQYTSVWIDEFTERGSLAPLRIVEQRQEAIRSTLGIKAAYDWEVGTVIVRPEVRLAWKHDYGDRSFSLDSSLVSGAGGIFTVEDSETGRDSLLLSAGVTVLWSDRTLAYLFYDGELGRQEYDAYSLSGGVRMSF